MTTLTIEQAAREISIWRKQKTSFKDPIPSQLWQAAIDLSKSYNYKDVAKIMKINPGDLKKKLGLPSTPRKKIITSSNVTFKEIPIVQKKLPSPSIEFITSSGIQIRIY